MSETLPPGVVFAGYRIERTLGSGGMGTVYLAAHPRLPRFDAVKVLPGELGKDPEYRARFAREAELAARLDHPNIVAVRDRGVEHGYLWIAMQLVDGIDAAEALRRTPGGLEPRLAAHIVTEAARGLDEAHRAGLLHRDVKPANLLLEPRGAEQLPRVYVSDFGIARGATDTAGLTETGSVLATVAYAAPEQITGAAVDHRADVYALGCTLYELLTGTKPFPRPTPAAVLHAHLADPPPRPTAHMPGLPPVFDAIVARALAKNPADRYPSCGALAADVASAAGGGAPRYAPVPVPVAASRGPVRRRLYWAMALFAVVVTVVAAGVVAATRDTTAPPVAVPASDTAVTSVRATSERPPPTGNSPLSWGDYDYIVQPFPNLLPASPVAGGYQGLRCVVVDEQMKQVPLVGKPYNGRAMLSCQGNKNPVDSVGVMCNANRTPTTVHAYTDVAVVGDGRWERPTGTGRVMWSDVADPRQGVVQIQFDDPARNYCQIHVWGGASGQEVMDRWWRDAPL
ncbi:serine/threonine-protein kinase [Nocardia wallacei]|uniref:serine/threonine-protein kinase n=1 Tax=Nocardia wallacei TaxID=480035 RepID=UPI00245781B5|nr:serine/threonine-protein kinase [Nocardia wallacei]